MRRSKPQAFRNKLDLSDRTQVRILKKRLRVTDAELGEIVGGIGNSIAAISKEVANQKACLVPKVAELPAAAVIASVTTVDPTPVGTIEHAPSGVLIS
ncbi:DUF3606 domain-containing protein [Bradyrhizobium sp. Pa8]|uniref:DUF3606 domain-containing protein n=1 Tax=Bradyrhizobium sp. Pa8 TaxID=3386552 RepID=UPI00403FBA9A